MSWITLAEADVLTVLSGPELEGYRAAALAQGQDDPVQPAIDDVTEEVRGFVAACAKNTLGPIGTIRSRLKTTALDLLAVRIPLRVARSPKSGRKDAAERSEARLKLVGECKFSIADPTSDEGTSAESESSPSPSFRGRDRRDARREHSGL